VYNVTNSSGSAYFFGTTLGSVRVRGFFAQDNTSALTLIGTGVNTYNSSLTSPDVVFAFTASLQQQSSWQQIQANALTYLTVSGNAYANAPVQLTYNNTAKVATFNVRNNVPSREFLVYSNGVQYAHSLPGDAYTLTGLVYYSVHNASLSTIYGTFNYSNAGQSFQWFVSDSASGLKADAYMYWRTTGSLPGGQAVVVEFNAPVISVQTTSRVYVNGSVFFGVFSGAPNSFFLFNVTNACESGSTGAPLAQNFYVMSAWNSTSNSTQDSTLWWNVVESALVWDNTQTYVYRQNYDLLVQGTTPSDSNLIVF